MALKTSKPPNRPLENRRVGVRLCGWGLAQRRSRFDLPVYRVKPHDFRRFVGTRLVKERGIRAAQQALGHKSIETTARNYDLSSLERGMTENLY